MRHLAGLCTTLALAATVGGCATVRTTKVGNVDLSRYRTFAFYEPQKPNERQVAFERSPASQNIREEIARDLVEKGITTAPPQQADFLVSYHVVLRERYDVNDWGYGPGWWGGPYGWGDGVTVSEYTEGTIIVDFIDPRENRVFWRGTVTDVVNHPENPNPSKIAAAVDKVMKRYPATVAREGTPPTRF